MPPTVPAGLPSSLLERRPDLVAAERRVAAAFARTDEAQAAKMPTLALTGSVGTASTDLLETLNPANLIWQTGAAFVAPLLDQGGREAQVEIATAQQEAAVASYGAVALTAFSEVESSLANGAFLTERERLLQIAVNENQSAVQAAEAQFEVGAIDQLSLLQIQTRLFSSQAALIRIQSGKLTQRVNLHLALGGSFEDTTN
jgi:outer membrane protein TolC